MLNDRKNLITPISDGPKNKTDGSASQAGSIPTLSLPEGGGAIRGIGEKFATNPVNGTATIIVPFLGDRRELKSYRR
jgi:hypothetical protein